MIKWLYPEPLKVEVKKIRRVDPNDIILEFMYFLVTGARKSADELSIF